MRRVTASLSAWRKSSGHCVDHWVHRRKRIPYRWATDPTNILPRERLESPANTGAGASPNPGLNQGQWILPRFHDNRRKPTQIAEGGRIYRSLKVNKPAWQSTVRSRASFRLCVLTQRDFLVLSACPAPLSFYPPQVAQVFVSHPLREVQVTGQVAEFSVERTTDTSRHMLQPCTGGWWTSWWCPEQ